MTMGWHMMMQFSPALFGCYIWDGNHSFKMLRRSKECVINIPTTQLVNKVVGIGNCSGSNIDKFKKFGLTPVCGPLTPRILDTDRSDCVESPPSDFHFSKFVHSISGHRSPFPIPETLSAFHPRAQRIAFRRRGVHQQRRLFGPWNPRLQRSPNSNRLC
jgi:Flavin reductase like domain